MTIEEFSKELSKMMVELFHGMNVGDVPLRLTFQLWEEHPDPIAPLQVDLMIRRRWKE